ncbi:hypothetical protein DFP79_2451 [Marinomonas balearica]|uniref:Uncharacterized protein n=1 Tax=Marinomonas balearica TaxID=491947 RepID=A0A4R6M5R0_9GAMM|nr:hypothetical protein DFP79_2451 [Marinomonas balearica]
MIEIARYFNLSHGGSASVITQHWRERMAEDKAISQDMQVILKNIANLAS